MFNLAIRMVYPFMPEFGRALHVSQETLVLVTSSRFALSLSAPIFAGLPERFGRRNVMLFAMTLFVCVVALVVAAPSFFTFVLALYLASFAKTIYDPAAYSYWSERTDYARRGLVVATYETSWSLSFLAGMPLVGWLMARNASNAWQYPFMLMALAGAFATLTLRNVLQNDKHALHHQTGEKKTSHAWRAVFGNAQVWSGLLVGFLASAANENFLIILGVWLENSFGMSLTALGFASFIIGGAELLGEGGVMGFVDRLGKRRAVLLGLAASTFAFVALLFLARNASGALLGLFLLFLTFEFTLVATLPLMSELAPSARPQTMSVNATVLLMGRMAGAVAGGLLFKLGLAGNLGLGALLNVIALGVVYWGIKKA